MPCSTPVQTLRKWYRKIQLFFSSFNGYSPCYAMRFTPKAVRKFFSDLKAMTEVRAVIYTTLNREACDRILEEINLSSYFGEGERIYSKNGSLSAD